MAFGVGRGGGAMPVEAMGYRMGWEDAERFARGTRADRREVRRRLAKSGASYAAFWRAYRDAVLPRLEAFAGAIREGRLPRTCRPSRIYAAVNRG